MDLRLTGVEGSYFLSEQLSATKRHMENLIEQGKLPATASDSMSTSKGFMSQFLGEELPVTVIKSRPASEVYLLKALRSKACLTVNVYYQ